MATAAEWEATVVEWAATAQDTEQERDTEAWVTIHTLRTPTLTTSAHQSAAWHQASVRAAPPTTVCAARITPRKMDLEHVYAIHSGRAQTAQYALPTRPAQQLAADAPAQLPETASSVLCTRLKTDPALAPVTRTGFRQIAQNTTAPAT
jgi:hypothetical protein